MTYGKLALLEIELFSRIILCKQKLMMFILIFSDT